MNTTRSISPMRRFFIRRGLVFGLIIITALLAFEIFNYSTTEFALNDLLGDLSFLGISWATILALAFCGIDFAGVARLFTPEDSNPQQHEAWYLFGAWLLAATMNAMLTWWGVSLAILEKQSSGDAVITQATLLRVVPIFVAILVWLIRVLIIGTFSVAGDRLFSQGEQKKGSNRSYYQASPSAQPEATTQSASPPRYRPAPKPANLPDSQPTQSELTYTPVQMSSRSNNTMESKRAEAFFAPKPKRS